MSDDQFAQLFKYMEAFRSDVNQRFDAVHHDLGDIRGTIAELSGRVEDYHNEFMVLSHQFDEFRGKFNF